MNRSLAFAIFAGLLLWICTIILSGAGWNPFHVNWNFSNPGAFGDSFGPISASMAALAAVAAIAAFREQKNEILRLQERERHDDKRRDAENAAQENLRRLDARDRREEREESTFFQLLSTFQNITRDTDIVSSSKTNTGRDAFRSMVLSFQSYLSICENVSEAWANTARKHENDLNHYFRLLYHIILFIDKSNLSDKRLYVRIVRALLSESELTLLALNCAYGEGREKFADLVRKYALLHSLSSAMRKKWGLEEVLTNHAFEVIGQ